MILIVYLSIVLFCFFAAIGIIRFLFLIVTVEHESMAPTLRHGDRVLVLRRGFGQWLRKGKIVLVTLPSDEIMPLAQSSGIYIKRVLAMSGENITLAITPPSNQAGRSTLPLAETDQETRTWSIPARHLFVCGDNRELSTDSRQWGPVPLRRVSGLVLKKLRHTPAQRLMTAQPPGRPLVKSGLQPGEAAPVFSAQTWQGETVALQDYGGLVLLLLFVTGAPNTYQYLPDCLEFVDSLGELGATVLLACDADAGKVQKLVHELAIRLPVLAVSHLKCPMIEDYGISMMPAYCLIDGQGRVLTSGLAMLGDSSWQEEILKQLAQKQSEVI